MECLMEIENDFKFSMKKSHYELINGPFIQTLNLATKESERFAKTAMERSGANCDDPFGLLQTSVAIATRDLSTYMFSANAKVQKTIIQILGILRNVLPEEKSFFKQEFNFPLNFKIFFEKANSRCEWVQATLSHTWTARVSEIIESQLGDFFNLKETNIEVFERGRFNDFIRLVNLIMTSQLKTVAIDGIKTFLKILNIETFEVPVLPFEKKGSVDFLQQNRPQELNKFDLQFKLGKILSPLFIINLNVYRKGEMVVENFENSVENEINFEPLLDNLNSFLLNLVSLPFLLTEKHIPRMENILLPSIFSSTKNNLLPFDRLDPLVFRGQEQVISIMKTVLKEAENILKSYQDQYSQLYQQITVDPKMDASQWKLLSKNIENTVDRCLALEILLLEMKEIWHILLKYRLHVSEEISLSFWECCAFQYKISDELNRANERLDFSKQLILDHLKVDKDHISSSVDAYLILVQTLEKVNGTSSDEANEMCSRVRNLRIWINQILELSSSVNNRENLIEISCTVFSALHQLLEIFVPYETLWMLAADIKNLIFEWQESIFTDLDADGIQVRMMKWKNTIKILISNFESIENPKKVVSALKYDVDTFYRYMVVIMSLRNTALKEIHWQRLSSVIGISFQEINNMKLKEVMDLDLELVEDVIADISKDASTEMNLETALENMRHELTTNEFEIRICAGEEHCFIENIEEAISHYEDQLIISDSLMSSASQSPILTKIEIWSDKLLRAQKILTNWEFLQCKFVQIFPIFNSQNTSPIEHLSREDTESFAALRKLMNLLKDLVSKNKKLILPILRSDLNEMLDSACSRIEIILKNLSFYIESKRNKFGRLYFLSEVEFLQLISGSYDVKNLQNHISACFPQIKELILSSSDVDENSIQGNTLPKDYNSCEISGLFVRGVQSIDEEEIEFKHPIKISHSFEEWLPVLESSIGKAIRRLFKIGIEIFSKNSILVLISRFPCQVVVVVLQLFFSKFISTQIGLKEFRNRLLQDLNLVINTVTKTDLAMDFRLKCESVITLLYYMIESIDRLNNNDTFTPLKFFADDDCSTIQIRVQDFQINYGNEYVGICPRLVLGESTQKCISNLLLCVHHSTNSTIIGDNGVGKTELIKDFARYLGRMCYIIPCSEKTEQSLILVKLKSAISTGCWLCFDNLHLIPADLLSYVGQQINILHKGLQIAIKSKRTTLQFEGIDFPAKPDFHIFSTAIAEKFWRNIPINFRTQLTAIFLLPPDISVLAEILLVSKGYIFAQEVAGKLCHAIKALTTLIRGNSQLYDFSLQKIRAVIETAFRFRLNFGVKISETISIVKAIQLIFGPQVNQEDLSIYHEILRTSFGEHQRFDVHEKIQSKFRKAMEDLTFHSKDDYFFEKTTQLYEALDSFQTIILVGDSHSGKTAAQKVIQHYVINEGDPLKIFKIFGSATTKEQIYGFFDNVGHWQEGILSKTLSKADKYIEKSTDMRKKSKYSKCGLSWIVYDGPLDNSTEMFMIDGGMDKRNPVVFGSGESKFIDKHLRIIFETESIQNASPSIIMRGSLIFMSEKRLSYESVLHHALLNLPSLLEPHSKLLRIAHHILVQPLLTFSKTMSFDFFQNDNSLLRNMFVLLESMFIEIGIEGFDRMTNQEQTCWVLAANVFSVIWNIGSSINWECRKKFDAEIRKNLKNILTDLENRSGIQKNILDQVAAFPLEETVFDYYFEPKLMRWQLWKTKQLENPIKIPVNCSDIVLTTDCIRVSYLTRLILNGPALGIAIVGHSGVGKSTVAKIALSNENLSLGFGPTAQFYFSGKSDNDSSFINKIEKNIGVKRFTAFGAKKGQPRAIFIDDMNSIIFSSSKKIPILLEIWRMWMETGSCYFKNSEMKIEGTKIEELYVSHSQFGGTRGLTVQKFTNAMESTFQESLAKKNLKVEDEDFLTIVRILQTMIMVGKHIAICGNNNFQISALVQKISVLGNFHYFEFDQKDTYFDSKRHWISFLETVFSKSFEIGEEKIIIFLNSNDLNFVYQWDHIQEFIVSQEIEEIINSLKSSHQSTYDCLKTDMKELFGNIHVVMNFTCENDDLCGWNKHIKQFPVLLNKFSVFWLRSGRKQVIEKRLLNAIGKSQFITKLEKNYGSILKFFEICEVKQSLETIYNRDYCLIQNFVEIFNSNYSNISLYQEQNRATLLSITKSFEIIERTKNEYLAMTLEVEQTKIKTQNFLTQMEEKRVSIDKINSEHRRQTEILEKIKTDLNVIQEGYRQELSHVSPVLQQAIKAVELLTKSDLYEIKSMISPPRGIQAVMEAVCLVFKHEHKPNETVWESARRLVGDPKFVNAILTFDKDGLTTSLIYKIEAYTNSPDFNVRDLQKVSKAIGSLGSWIIALQKYHCVQITLQPKKKQILDLEQRISQLRIIVDKLFADKTQLDKEFIVMKSSFDSIIQQKEFVNMQFKQAEVRNKASQQLNTVLLQIRNRLNSKFDEICCQKDILIGNSLLAASMISHCGPKTNESRELFLKQIQDNLAESKIAFNTDFTLSNFNNVDANEFYFLHELPVDLPSLECYFIAKYHPKIPIIVDIDERFCNTLEIMEREFLIEIITSSDQKKFDKIQTAIEKKTRIVIRQDEPNLDENLIGIVNQIGFEKIGERSDNDIVFRLYIIVNDKKEGIRFDRNVTELITTQSDKILVKDIILDMILQKNQARMREQCRHLNIDCYNCRSKIKFLDERLQKFVESIKDNDLSGSEMFRSVCDCEEQIQSINEKLSNTKATLAAFNDKLKHYFSISEFIAQIYSIISGFQRVSAAYQISVSRFIDICRPALLDPLDSNMRHIWNFKMKIVHLIASSVKIGMTKADSTLCQFLISIELENSLLDVDSKIKLSDIYFLINGSTISSSAYKKANPDEFPPNPSPLWLNKESWDMILNLSTLPKFRKFAQEFIRYANKATTPFSEQSWENVFYDLDPSKTKFPNRWEMELSKNEKMMVIRCLRPDNLIRCVEDFISNSFGKNSQNESTTGTLSFSYKFSSPQHPILMITPFDKDIIQFLRQFSRNKNLSNFVKILSLGRFTQNQFDSIFEEGIVKGRWIVLNNCHLDCGFLDYVHLRLVQMRLKQKVSKINPGFRLWIVGKPSTKIPDFIYANSINIMFDGTADLKTLIESIFCILEENISPHEFKTSLLYREFLFRIILVNVCLNAWSCFGPASWNCAYEFGINDTALAAKGLREIFNLNSSINSRSCIKKLQTLAENCFINQIHDIWDRRIVNTIFNDIMTCEWISNSTSKVEMILNGGNLDSSAATDASATPFSNIIQLPMKEIMEKIQESSGDVVLAPIDFSSEVVAENFIIHQNMMYFHNQQLSCEMLKTATLYFFPKTPSISVWQKHANVSSIISLFSQKILANVLNSVLDPAIPFNGVTQKLRKGGSRRSLDSISQAASSTGGLFQIKSGGKHFDRLLDENIRQYRRLILNLISEFNLILSLLNGTNTGNDLREINRCYCIIDEILSDKFPSSWKYDLSSYISSYQLTMWINDFLRRLNFIKDWYFARYGDHMDPVRGLVIYDITCMFSPEALILGISTM
ncbi:Dynein heavy chain 3, axonemal [Nowakowskiella sp. JEL0078]|nr:Dynein heavy chain 3, axonemal [Nowakowskiella sp. JEL0078]